MMVNIKVDYNYLKVLVFASAFFNVSLGMFFVKIIKKYPTFCVLHGIVKVIEMTNKQVG